LSLPAGDTPDFSPGSTSFIALLILVLLASGLAFCQADLAAGARSGEFYEYFVEPGAGEPAEGRSGGDGLEDRGFEIQSGGQGLNYGLNLIVNHDFIDADLTNFTLLITHDIAGLNEINGPLDLDGSRPALDGGADLRFYQGDTRLAIDIRNFTLNNDPGLSVMEIAVRAINISSSEDTAITMYWGNVSETAQPAADAPYGQYGAYDSYYKLVAPNGGSDRTINQWAFSGQGGISEGGSAGLVGSATHFGGEASQQYFEYGSAEAWDAILAYDSAYTMECLAKNENTASTLPQFMMAKVKDSGDYRGSYMLLINGKFTFGFHGDNSPLQIVSKDKAIEMVQDQWYYFSGTYDGSNSVDGLTLYIDGVAQTGTTQDETGTVSGIDHSDPFLIGARGWGKPNGQREWHGKLDEIRVSSTNRSSSWINANYNNLMNIQTFFSIGALEYELTINKTGQGSFNGNGTYTEGSLVNITASPDFGWEFVNWTGDVFTIANASSNETALTMAGDLSITANFEAMATPQITVLTPADGAITGELVLNISSSDNLGGHAVFVDWDNSLVSWWRMDDVSGSTIIDFMNRYNGSAINNASQASGGYFGKGLDLDGAGDYADFGEISEAQQQSVTFSIWVRLNSPSGTNNFFGGIGSGGTDRSWNLVHLGAAGPADGSIRWIVKTQDGQIIIDSDRKITDSNWHHYVGQYDGAAARVYIDGQLEKSAGHTGRISPGSWSLYVGQRQDEFGPISGSIDDVMVFNRSLSEDEIRSLYDATANQYVNDFTNQGDGTHSYGIYAQDLGGNVNSIEGRTVTLQTNIASNITSPSEGQIFSYANGTILLNVSFSGVGTNCNATISAGNLSIVGGATQTLGNLTDGNYTTFTVNLSDASNLYNKTYLANITTVCGDSSSSDTAGFSVNHAWSFENNFLDNTGHISGTPSYDVGDYVRYLLNVTRDGLPFNLTGGANIRYDLTKANMAVLASQYLGDMYLVGPGMYYGKVHYTSAMRAQACSGYTNCPIRSDAFLYDPWGTELGSALHGDLYSGAATLFSASSSQYSSSYDGTSENTVMGLAVNDSHTKINWTAELDLSDYNPLDLDSAVTLGQGLAYVNSSAFPELNETPYTYEDFSAEITLSGVDCAETLYFGDYATVDELIASGIECPADVCLNQSCENSILTFNATRFSGYGILDEEPPSSSFDNSTWLSIIGGANSDVGNAIAVDSSGNIYVTGYTNSYGAGEYDVWTIKYNSSGDQIWNKTIGGASYDYGSAIAVDSSDNIYVTGNTLSYGAGDCDVWTIKYNSSGDQIWNKTIGGASYDVGNAIAVDSSGNIYVTGNTYSYGAGISDVWTARMDSDGYIQKPDRWKMFVGGSTTLPTPSSLPGEAADFPYVLANDSESKSITGPIGVDNAHDFSVYEINTTGLTTLEFTWVGYSDLTNGGTGVNISAWNYTSSAWVTVNYTTSSTERTYFYDFTDLTDFTSDDTMYIMAVSRGDSGAKMSCPFLYTWNGTDFEVVTDVGGGGGLLYSSPWTPGGIGNPDPYSVPRHHKEATNEDYLHITDKQLQPKDGKYIFSLKEDRDEVNYMDMVELYVVDHPENVSIYSPVFNGMNNWAEQPYEDMLYYTVQDPQPPVSAYDTNGNDVLDTISEVDLDFVHGRALEWDTLTVDLGNLSGAQQIKILFNGYNQFATSEDYADRYAYLMQNPDEPFYMYAYPYAEVVAANGSWVYAPEDEQLFHAHGYPRTTIWDITHWFDENATNFTIRIHTHHNIQIDYIAVDTSVDVPINITKIKPTSAVLNDKGMSNKDYSKHPLGVYIYNDTFNNTIPYEGYFTKLGDVMELVADTDDRYVIMKPGDEVLFEFDELEKQEGMGRSYYLHQNGYYKGYTIMERMGYSSVTPEPYPYMDMAHYEMDMESPYENDSDYQDYIDTWNTRYLNNTGHHTMYVNYVNITATEGGGEPEPLFCGGSGTDIEPYQICTWTQLNNTRLNMSAYYVLNNSLDNETADYDGLGNDWVPIGNLSGPFEGSFEGGNRTITGLKIFRPDTDEAGLFGYIENGSISNLGLIDANVTGQHYVGALASSFWNASIINSYSAGIVAGNYCVGGLLGTTGHSSSVVSNSFSTADVTGNQMVGGFVGCPYTGSIINSYSTGDITGNQMVGGFVGSSVWGNIISSYALGNVYGNGSIGGFVGYHEKGNIEKSYATGNATGNISVGGFVGLIGYSLATINNSYSTGSVARESGAETSFGGFVGLNYQRKILNSYSTGSVSGNDNWNPADKGFAGTVDTGGSYEMPGNFWDMETSGQSSTAGNATGKTTAQMNSLSTFLGVGWDIALSDEDLNNGYPYLGWQGNNESYAWLISCTPSLTNTSWSAWQNQSSCLANDTQLQNRSLTQYDSNYCGEVANETFYEIQYVACDFCTPSLTNTSWSGWQDQGDCLTNDSQLQNRSLEQYDENFCGEVANQTFWDYQFIACNYCSYSLTNTSWGDWEDSGSCQANDTILQERNLTEYDANKASCCDVTGIGSDCIANTTFYDYQWAACDFCTPSLTNTSWSGWINITSCRINNTKLQQRNLTQYDSNSCGEVENETFYENRSSECSYCGEEITCGDSVCNCAETCSSCPADCGSCSSSCNSRDCNDNDGWYETGSTQWVSTSQCTEKEQEQEEYRNYGCDGNDCEYSVTQTRWLDSGDARNKDDGTSCDDNDECTDGDYCESGKCVPGEFICKSNDECEEVWACEAKECINGMRLTICLCDCDGKPCGENFTEEICEMPVVALPKPLIIDVSDELQMGEPIDISLIDASGNPIAGNIILIRPDGTEVLIDGIFYVDQPGLWEIRASADGFEDAQAQSLVSALPQEIDISTQVSEAISDLGEFLAEEPARLTLLLVAIIMAGGFFAAKKFRIRKKDVEKL
jgi:hypothetical protein